MIGTDIIEVARIEKLIKDKGDKFLNKIYTQNEIDYCESKGLNKYQYYAGRFAAKESIVKALSSDVHKKGSQADSSFFISMFEIVNNHKGVPIVNFTNNKIKEKISIRVSISHIEKYATAVAIIQDKTV
mgnify:CR=1 FL=1|tara:strand:+ start:99 stop:485 length:387 start_codon:yes stop_codon:yes gene_type:complete